MTKQEIYEWVVRLTAELHSTNFAKEFFDAVENKKTEKFDSLFETFKKNNFEMYLKFVGFGKVYNKLKYEDRAIFGEEDKSNGICIFNAKELDALSFWMLTILGDIYDIDFFADWPSKSSIIYVDEIEKAGYLKVYDFVSGYPWKEAVDRYSSLFELLIDVFKEEFDKK